MAEAKLNGTSFDKEIENTDEYKDLAINLNYMKRYNLYSKSDQLLTKLSSFLRDSHEILKQAANFNS